MVIVKEPNFMLFCWSCFFDRHISRIDAGHRALDAGPFALDADAGPRALDADAGQRRFMLMPGSALDVGPHALDAGPNAHWTPGSACWMPGRAR